MRYKGQLSVVLLRRLAFFFEYQWISLSPCNLPESIYFNAKSLVVSEIEYEKKFLTLFQIQLAEFSRRRIWSFSVEWIFLCRARVLHSSISRVGQIVKEKGVHVWVVPSE